MAPVAKSKVQKPSKVVKPKKNTKNTTVARKNHRFQPFSERVAKLKIDPIRRRRNVEEHGDVPEGTETHFGGSLEEWRDLNMSATFTAFAKEAAPLCEGLPALLYNESKMMDVLAAYIRRGDELAMEPLLHLLSSFARDLDARFEKHFQRAVSTVAEVAAKHADPAVVEWSFTCLAWLFKYLSRLLVPDLRPLYDLMAPYLGGEQQKPFIVRFAAESISFLVRKASAAYDRDRAPLQKIVAHMLHDCNDAPDLQRQGIMTLLTEAMRGVQGGLHSGGLAVLQCLLQFTTEGEPSALDPKLQIVTGVLTSVIHNTNSESFRPVQDAALTYIAAKDSTRDASGRLPFAHLIFTIVSVRKGTRISEWGRILSILRSMVTSGSHDTSIDPATRLSILGATAVTLQSATIDAVLPNLAMLQTLRTGAWTPTFLKFCDLFARLGNERFQQFLLPQFQEHIAEHWSESEDAILASLNTLPIPAQHLPCPDSFQARIVQRVADLGSSSARDPQTLTLAAASLRALQYLNLGSKTRKDLSRGLDTVVRRALEDAKSSETLEGSLSLGPCFAALLDFTDDQTQIADIWPRLCTASETFSDLPQYWKNLLRYSKIRNPADLQGPHVDQLQTALLQALSLPSHDIRQTSLDMIETLYQCRGQSVPPMLLTAITIESTPITFETSRRIVMDIRRLAQGYSDQMLDGYIQSAIASYCFGLLNVKLTSAWEEATNVLAEISKGKVGEERITSLVQDWLAGTQSAIEDAQQPTNPSVLDCDSDGFNVVSDFECSNFARMSAICTQAFESENGGRLTLTAQLSADHQRVRSIPETARARALRVLNKIPNIAEKRSRMLVPMLLRWANSKSQDGQIEEGERQRWNRADQKAMLSVFAQFTNPKVLFRQAEVYAALLNLCGNGDAEIQRSALKALCAWKNPSVVKYEDHLVNLLDESRFRDELAVFLQNPTDSDETTVQQSDHSELMPVFLHVVYGRVIAGGKQGKGARRRATFVALSRHGPDVLGMFIDIALGPLASLSTAVNLSLEHRLPLLDRVSLRKRLGFVNMFEDMLETLGPEMESFEQRVLSAVLLATVSASRALDGVGDVPDASLLRSIRQGGIQCLVCIFSRSQSPEMLAPASTALEELIFPRLERLPSENTQSVSGILRLISAWSSSPNLSQCLTQKPSLLHKVADLLQECTAKDEVRMFVLTEILDNLLISDSGQNMATEHVRSFTTSIGRVLDQEPSKPVLDACVGSLTGLSSIIDNEAEAENILKVCGDLLRKPAMFVSPATKVGLLRTVTPIVENFDIQPGPILYDAVCGLFSRLQGQGNRSVLAATLVSLCKRDEALLVSAEWCAAMNAVGSGLQEVDHERRERGFTAIYENASSLSPAQWQPILQNCLFFIRDSEDMVNRSSASQALRRFVTAATHDKDCQKLLADTILPGIERGMQANSELVRSEYLQLLGHIVNCFSQWPATNDMIALSVGDDDEASVFINVLHIQHHRRLRALRRLADEAAKLSSRNTTRFFIPLLEHFVFDQAEGDAGRTLSDQTIQTLGALAQSLTWPAFRTTFRRYIGYLSSKEDHEKAVLRLIGTFVDALATSSESAERHAKKCDIITRDFLPPLIEYVHHKDESTIDRRMPVAVTIVKLLLVLPESEITARLAPVLSDVSHVLRSRSQEARDQTRKTLASISALVGPGYFGFILKELRSALQRGYQLHVLSFTVHSLLLNVSETCEPGDLDYCVAEIVSVIMDDIFGVTGQEKDAEEYKSGMKEVKSSKSFDTMELLARITPVQKLGLLVQPLRDLLAEKLDSKMLKKTDDLLTRLRKGLDLNPAADTRDMLVFCHEIVRQVGSEQQAAAHPAKKPAERRINRYLIQMESANKLKTKGATTSQLFKLASFALNLLRKVLRRHEDIMTPGNMAGFLAVAGDALVQGQDDVQTAAVKLLSTIMKLSLPDLDANAPTYVNEAVRLIKGASNVTTDSAKAALELVTAILREKRSVAIKDRDIGEVLKCIKADIDEPDRQGIIYKFLRAVLGRKIIIKEVYELMDEVGKVVVTNPDRNVRESARSAYFQFVMEYPQGKDRWNKQAAFFVENLKYERPNGRQSVMELLNQLLSKVGDDILKQLAFTLFVALVPVLAHDDDRSCRQMAGILIGKLFERADEEQYEVFMKLVDNWLANEENQAIMVAALRCWMVILRTRAPEKQRVEALRDRTRSLIADPEDLGSAGAERAMAALQTAETLMETRPDVAFAPDEGDQDLCKPLAAFVTIESAEARELAAKLLGTFLSHIASSSAQSGDGLAAIPLHGAHGIVVGSEDLRQLCYRSLSALRTNTDQLNEAIINHDVRNLVFLGRCFAANGMRWKENADGTTSESEDETEAACDPSALAYLLNRLTYITRQETFPAACRAAAIRAQTALLPHLPEQKVPNLHTMIRPLYLLTDASMPQPLGEAHRALTDAARELLEAVQKAVGSETYLAALSAARKEVGERREERRRKRRVEAVSRPEAWAKAKRRKVEGKKAREREKGMEMRGKRRGW